VQARRTWADSFGRVFGRTAPAKSVHVSVFSTPPFIGVRYGADARLRALFSDILIGPPMQAIQQRAAAGQATRALYELVALMEQRFKSPKGLTWVETFASLGAPEILSETVDTLTTADWELYNRWLLRPALALQARLADVVPGGVVPIVLLIVATLLLKLLKAVVRALTSLLERQWAAGVRVASNVAIEWLIALPTIGSMLLLAHGRLEDRLFVAALLGRSSVDVAPLFETGLGVRTHFLIAVAVAAIVIGGRLLDHLYLMVLGDFPDKVQREMFAQRTHVEQFFLSLPSSDTVDFDAERPYTSAFFGLCWAWLKELGAWTLVLWVLPLSVTVYIGARALVASLIDLRGNLKLRAQLRETLATYQTAA
jgi:hypothetical protein